MIIVYLSTTKTISSTSLFIKAPCGKLVPVTLPLQSSVKFSYIYYGNFI